MTELEARFWSKVDRTGTGCWLWTAGRSRRGYGVFSSSQRYVNAHRVAWELTYGAIPPGLLVCHRCDNPPCVNPEHLFLGTAADNARDAAAKGRLLCGDENPSRRNREIRPRGEGHANAKLTAAAVLRLREDYRRGFSYRELGVRYGIQRSHVHNLIAGRAWKHLLSGPAERLTRRKTHCPAGHPYAGENLYVSPGGSLNCRICRRESCRRYRGRHSRA